MINILKFSLENELKGDRGLGYLGLWSLPEPGCLGLSENGPVPRVKGALQVS